jgi:nitronate monooxygenase
MITTLHRPVCDLLRCTYPIVLAGMGGVARSELVGAITQAGGFGFLGMVREPVALIQAEVQRLREHSVHNFGINLIPAATDTALLEAQVATCIELAVPVVGLFWDLSATVVQRLRDAGIVVVCQVGAVVEARAAEAAGAQVLIAQGVEAGGHVRGDQSLHELVAEVAEGTRLPVLAAGGIVDGADVATVLSLGAQGAVLGTALIATHEAFAHAYHKQRLVEANADDTILTDVFHINWPSGAKVRVLANSVTRGERGDAFSPTRTVIGEEGGRPIHLFSTESPLRSMTGDFEAMALYAGKGVGRVTKVIGAADRMRAIVAEATALLEAGTVSTEDRVELASPACSAYEMDDRYMGFASRDELLPALNELLEAERAGSRVTLRTAKEIAASDLKSLVMAIHRDEARWCGVLTKAIYQLQGAPTQKTGAFYDKAMAIADIPARLDFLNRGQSWVVRKLQALLPTVRDEAVHTDLAAMLASHERNIDLVAARPPTAVAPAVEARS